METSIFIGIFIWTIVAVTAYPRNKKFRLHRTGRFGDQVWTYWDAIISIIACLFGWWVVWGFIFFEWFDDYAQDDDRWWNKRSRF